jgi:DNA-binding transcriptional ArsR family regulator
MCGLDAVFRALADERRRIALSSLGGHETLTLPDMAEFVAERERSAPLTSIDAAVVRDVYLSLYHTHVPVLEDAGVVRYEQERDLVTRTDQYEPLLRRGAAELAEIRGSRQLDPDPND